MGGPSFSVAEQVRTTTYFFRFLILITIFSLAGLPPFFGFLRKVLVIKHPIVSVNIVLLLLLVYRSVITLFYYIRFRYISIIYTPKIKDSNMPKTYTYLKRLYSVSLVGFTLMGFISI